MSYKKLMTWDSTAKLYRIGAFLWGKKPGEGGFRKKLSLALHLSRYGMACYRKEEDGGRIITFLGIRVHYVGVYVGILV